MDPLSRLSAWQGRAQQDTRVRGPPWSSPDLTSLRMFIRTCGSFSASSYLASFSDAKGFLFLVKSHILITLCANALSLLWLPRPRPQSLGTPAPRGWRQLHLLHTQPGGTYAFSQREDLAPRIQRHSKPSSTVIPLINLGLDYKLSRLSNSLPSPLLSDSKFQS